MWLRRYMSHARAMLLATAVIGLVSSTVAAFTLKTLVMPGKVAQAHAAIEEHCERCHETTAPTKQSDLCFTCHKDVRDDVARAQGFHGRTPERAAAACYTCHKEHAGRDAKLATIDPKTFSHGHTDFPLTGAHGKAACGACHSPGTAYREAPAQCSGCHAKDDRHSGSLGNNCAGCHTETAWRNATFDHKTTPFPLSGAHAAAPCAGCHKNGTFAGTPADCNSCHRPQDVHKGRNGAQCGACHAATAWPVKFDHTAKTGFALQGKHQTLTCAGCHVKDLATALPKTCVGCHRSGDAHSGKLGTTCSDCHSSTQWSGTRFDHTAIASFPLVGAHATLQCTSCHANGLTAQLGRDCTSCHARDDPHKGQLAARCDTCHGQTAWTEAIHFDHDLASFPLLGAHATLTCAECHATRAFHDAGSACASCHADKDPHAGRFGTQCGTCHHPTDWHAARFDHAKATRFPLTGAHAMVACASCHQVNKLNPTGAASVPRECGQCHRQSDPHGGRFGAACGDCHTTQSFTSVRRR